MEPASRLLGKLKFPADSISSEELVCAAWSVVVGKRIARHARAERVVRNRLIVGVDDEVWRKQLFTMSRIMVGKMAEKLGATLIDEIEFRVAPERRGPQRAERLSQKLPDDEADGIEDPGLRRLYITSRRRGRA
jgi:predicted nucleic acid-binding Zn ribbon protein